MISGYQIFFFVCYFILKLDVLLVVTIEIFILIKFQNECHV